MPQVFLKLRPTYLRQHPEVLILAMHATPPNRHCDHCIEYRTHREKAEEDDMKVVNTGIPNLDVNDAGDRFEAEIGVLSVSGERIGALSVLFPYRSGDDKTKLQQIAEKVRDELREKVPTLAKLFEPTR